MLLLILTLSKTRKHLSAPHNEATNFSSFSSLLRWSTHSLTKQQKEVFFPLSVRRLQKPSVQTHQLLRELLSALIYILQNSKTRKQSQKHNQRYRIFHFSKLIKLAILALQVCDCWHKLPVCVFIFHWQWGDCTAQDCSLTAMHCFVAEKKDAAHTHSPHPLQVWNCAQVEHFHLFNPSSVHSSAHLRPNFIQLRSSF